MKIKIITAIAAFFAIGSAFATKVHRINQGWYLAANPSMRVSTATALTMCPDETTLACAYRFYEGAVLPATTLHRSEN